MFKIKIPTPPAFNWGKSTLTFMILGCGVFLHAQRQYTFNYHSLYEISQSGAATKKAETAVYDNYRDASYQMIIYPDEARLRDEGRNEMHYFKIRKENDSTRYDYDYSLKVNFEPILELTSLQVKKITDLDYEISFVKKSKTAEIKERMEICLQESEDDLLNTSYTGLSNKETAPIMNSLRRVLPPNGKYYIAGNVYTSGRYIQHYNRVVVHPVNLTVTVPINVVYRNSFLKN